MCPHLKLIPCVFMDKGRTIDRKFANARGERDGAMDNSATPLRGIDNFCRCLIQDVVIEGAKSDANAGHLFGFHFFGMLGGGLGFFGDLFTRRHREEYGEKER